MSTDPGYTPVIRTGTCHTPDCGNAGHPVTLEVPADSAWTCGGCGQPITDLADGGEL